MESLKDAGVPAQQGSCSEIYLEQAFGNELRPKSRLKNAELLGKTSIMLFVHPTLKNEEVDRICCALYSVLESYKSIVN